LGPCASGTFHTIKEKKKTIAETSHVTKGVHRGKSRSGIKRGSTIHDTRSSWTRERFCHPKEGVSCPKCREVKPENLKTPTRKRIRRPIIGRFWEGRREGGCSVLREDGLVD